MNPTREEVARTGPASLPSATRARPPLGDAQPRQEAPPDLRLLAPALAAWAAASIALGVPGRVAGLGVAVCALAGLALFAAGAGRRGGRGIRATSGGSRGSGGPRGSRIYRTGLLGIAVTLLCAAAAGTSAALHAADIRQGPLPDLADSYAHARAEVTVTGDPRATRPHVRGARASAGVIVIPAEVVRLHAPAAGRSATADTQAGTHAGGVGTAEENTWARLRTPVLLMVVLHRGPGDDDSGARTGTGEARRAALRERTAWLRLLPSTGLRVNARLVPPAEDRPGGKDIAAVLRVDATAPHVVRGPTTTQRLAGELRSGLRKATGGLSTDARGLLPGLVVGDTSRLRPELEDAFRSTDMTHLTAVSGANLSILLVLLIGPPGLAHRAERGGLAPRVGLSLRGTAVVGALLTLAFVVVCRPEPSVLRAAACGLITIAAIGTGRRRSLLPALAAAVLLLVFYDPWLARDFGFLLSVLATASLLLVAPHWCEALRRRGWPPRIAEALSAAAAAQAACAPVVAVLAAHVSLVAVPCNLLAEFAVAPATVLGFAALAAAPVAMPVAKGLAWLASWPAEAIAGIARTGAGLPGAEIGWPGSWAGALGLAAALSGLMLVAAWLRLPHRPWLCAGCVLVLLVAVTRPAPLVRPFTGWPPTGWRMVACDVGQGDALALAVDGERGGAGGAVVVDAGPDPRAVDRCLRDLGVTSIPLIVLTHFHADHVAGLPGLLRGRKVGAIQTTGTAEPAGQAEFVRRTARQAKVPVVPSAAGERRRAGDLSWEVLWPQPGPGPRAGPGSPLGAGAGAGAGAGGEGEGEGANDASVTLLVRTRGLTLFLPGDLEPAAQQGLLALHPGLPRVDVLKVAHHGSRFQDAGLLGKLRPRVALVSAGRDNPYGHPAPETLRRLSEAGALVARTDQNGALALTSRPDGTPAVATERGTLSPTGSMEGEPRVPPRARPEHPVPP